MKTFALGLFDERLRRLVVGTAAAALLSVAFVGGASADTAASGNGGTVTTTADGGAVGVGDANTGEDEGGTATIADLLDGEGDLVAEALSLLVATE